MILKYVEFPIPDEHCIRAPPNEGGIGKSIPNGQKISRDPRDFLRGKPEGNLAFAFAFTDLVQST